jgi:hypothetical protein
VNTGNAQDADGLPVPENMMLTNRLQQQLVLAAGACVMHACKNSSAMLFVGAKSNSVRFVATR